MQRIFISYRRADAPGDAGRLADHLYQRFGRDRVFLDIDTIDPGTDFVQALQSSLQQTAAVLVVIGPLWTTLRDEQGTRRLDDPNDFVRLEVEAALARGIPVVPVRVQGAAMPRADELPASLAAFATRQAFVIDHHDFHADAERLCHRLAAMMGDEGPRRSLLQRWWPAAALLVLLALGVAGYQLLRGGGTPGDADTRVVPVTVDPRSPTGRNNGPPARTDVTPPMTRPVPPAVTPPVTAPGKTVTPSVNGRDEASRGRVARPPRASNANGRTTSSTPPETGPATTSGASGAVAPGRSADATRDEAASSARAREEAERADRAERAQRAEALVAEATALRRRQQYVDALAALARARDLAPASDAVRRTQEDVAMEWLRNVRIEGEKSSFGEAIKPGLTVIDAALPGATGTRRADLLAHSGWATFLLWRDGNRQLDPEEWYRDALKIDPNNPYANAMLAHWILFRGNDVPRAAALFTTAYESKRAVDIVRMFQWSAYDNTSTPAADPLRIQLADGMRRDGTRLTMGQAQILWRQFSVLSVSRETQRQQMLEGLPPDDYLATLSWAFDEYAANDASRQRILRYYRALLHARAGRTDQALADLKSMAQELEKTPGQLQDAVRAALTRLQKR